MWTRTLMLHYWCRTLLVTSSKYLTLNCSVFAKYVHPASPEAFGYKCREEKKRVIVSYNNRCHLNNMKLAKKSLPLHTSCLQVVKKGLPFSWFLFIFGFKNDSLFLEFLRKHTGWWMENHFFLQSCTYKKNCANTQKWVLSEDMSTMSMNRFA